MNIYYQFCLEFLQCVWLASSYELAGFVSLGLNLHVRVCLAFATELLNLSTRLNYVCVHVIINETYWIFIPTLNLYLCVLGLWPM